MNEWSIKRLRRWQLGRCRCQHPKLENGGWCVEPASKTIRQDKLATHRNRTGPGC
ncbi:hypothetical protein KY290_022708 [Solanum tuberosum]|uniref:Uncharacterized protein n=1 Tax=Solanum tuberosum TaxID=4113 RepID=A0ABQ7V557_SOLTU|nr:hypothetical protein KY284_021606 [Solanum tuberosum]KAH0759215.1 hypothetical protein KY290_022708 [Solanum tuberosum]